MKKIEFGFQDQNFCSEKHCLKNEKVFHSVGEKCLQIKYLTEDFYPEYISNSYNGTTARLKNTVKNGQKPWTDTS